MNMTKLRLCFISERLAPPLDEGFKNLALHLTQTWRQLTDLRAWTCFGQDIPAHSVENLRADRLFLRGEFRQRLRAFRPQLVVYLPTASTTLFALARGRMLRAWASGSKLALIALQPRPLPTWQRHLIPLLAPDLLLIASDQVLEPLPPLPCPIISLSSGVDLQRFRPAPDQRKALRAKYGVPLDARILLHVGHLKRERNVHALAQLQGLIGWQVLVVGSTSTEQERDLLTELQDGGVRVIAEYVEISELYQLADAYVFPTIERQAAIGVPLSVLEAMACNLPVISMPFGGLPATFQADPARGLIYADTLPAMADALSNLPAQPRTRELVAAHNWEAIAKGVLERVRQELAL